MNETQATYVGTHTAYFCVNRVRGQRVLHRVPMASPDEARGFWTHPWPREAEAEVRLHVFEAGRRLYVGHVEVVTTPQTITTPYGDAVPPPVTPTQVGTDLWRLIPLGALEAEAVSTVGKDEDRIAATTLNDDAYERLARAAEAPHRGRRSSLTPELLRLVADAYNRGGRTGVKAVQEALQQAGFPGASADRTVTRDQASKAVVVARRKGFLPPAPTRHRP